MRKFVVAAALTLALAPAHAAGPVAQYIGGTVVSGHCGTAACHISLSNGQGWWGVTINASDSQQMILAKQALITFVSGAVWTHAAISLAPTGGKVPCNPATCSSSTANEFNDAQSGLPDGF